MSVLLTPKQAARELLLHPSTLRRLTEEGAIACQRTPGGHRRYRESDIKNLRSQIPSGDYLQLSIFWADALEDMLRTYDADGDGTPGDLMRLVKKDIASTPGDLWDWIERNNFQWNASISLSGQYFLRCGEDPDFDPGQGCLHISARVGAKIPDLFVCDDGTRCQDLSSFIRAIEDSSLEMYDHEVIDICRQGGLLAKSETDISWVRPTRSFLQEIWNSDL